MSVPVIAKKQMDELFTERKCLMVHELANELGYAVISVRRFLKVIGYFRSYSHNGKWYTLRTIPRFNRDGIWEYDGICFSRYQSLTRTIVHLIEKSPAGLSAKDLGDKVHQPCHTVLTNLFNTQKIGRIKPYHEFIYLSRDEKKSQQQKKALKVRTMPSITKPFTAETAVFVLVEFIKHPESSLEQITQYVKKNRGIRVLPENIDMFLEAHDIKKNPNSHS